MSWELFVGDGTPHREDPDEEAWERIPPLRSWRQRTPSKARVPARLFSLLRGPFA